MFRPALIVASIAIAVALLACAQQSPAKTPSAGATEAPESTTTLPTLTTTSSSTATDTVTASPETATPAQPDSTAILGTVTATVATVTPEPPDSTPASTPAPAVEHLTNVRLKYLLFERFGDLWYCDPDYWPVARADEGDLAEQHLPGIRQDVDTFEAILEHLGYPEAATYPPDQTLAIYREWKMLRALVLEATGDAFRFEARFTRDGGQTGVLASGTIDAAGQITVTSEGASDPPICPICLARGTLIATPSGPVPVEEIREGIPVWTLSADGSRVAAVVLEAGGTRAPATHEVVRLALDDGRVVRASPPHPLADGRRLVDLASGDEVDGARVVEAERIPYRAGWTYDLLPSGSTGVYWADGVPVASTLRAPETMLR